MRISSSLVGGLAVVALASLLSPSAAAADKERGREIELYTRKPSDKPGKNDRMAAEILNLDKLAEVEQAHLADVQLGKTYDYEGIALDKVLEGYKKKAGKANRVLLHFANGMIIPLAVPGDGETTGIFIARAIRVGENMVKTFPEVPKKEGLLPEPRPVVFAGNKVVIEDGAHPLQPASATATFSPWSYVDSLTAIELVEGKAYDRLFEVDKASPEVASGTTTFLGRCQFCHGVRELGATYGWDFVVPTPIYTQKDQAALLNHVKGPAKVMPAQKDAASPEIDQLWAWLKAIADAKPRAYRP